MLRDIPDKHLFIIRRLEPLLDDYVHENDFSWAFDYDGFENAICIRVYGGWCQVWTHIYHINDDTDIIKLFEHIKKYSYKALRPMML